MYEKPLVPQEVSARARALGRIPFGFGPRFFVALVLGFVWLVPAWWSAEIYFRDVPLGRALPRRLALGFAAPSRPRKSRIAAHLDDAPYPRGSQLYEDCDPQFRARRAARSHRGRDAPRAAAHARGNRSRCERRRLIASSISDSSLRARRCTICAASSFATAALCASPSDGPWPTRRKR